jgi:hypothetical protein
MKPFRIDRTEATQSRSSLADVLSGRGLQPTEILVTYNDLHPADTCADFRTITDVMDINAHHLLDRMQDGPRIANDTLVMSFVGLGDSRALLTGFRRFFMRRQGIVPGEIVYDYDAAHLLHAFIARAQSPHFYDVQDQDGLSDLIGQLTVQWPDESTQAILRADSPLLVIEN